MSPSAPQPPAHALTATCPGPRSLMWSLWKELQPSLHFSINKVHTLCYLLVCRLEHVHVGCVVAQCPVCGAGSDAVRQPPGGEESRGILPGGRGTLPHYRGAGMSASLLHCLAQQTLLPSQASNAYDELMHVVKLWGSEVRAVLEPSTGYTPGSCSPPPASPEGDTHHSLLQTDSATVTYSWDSPGQPLHTQQRMLRPSAAHVVHRPPRLQGWFLWVTPRTPSSPGTWSWAPTPSSTTAPTPTTRGVYLSPHQPSRTPLPPPPPPPL